MQTVLKMLRLLIIIREEKMTRTPIHPGEILADELDELELTATELADQLRVPANCIDEIIAGKRNLTAEIALRLGKYFGTTAEFWLNLQKSYELDQARAKLGAELDNVP
jgi:addiction module HigA family antidote